MAKYKRMTTLNEEEQRYAKKFTALTWADMQDKFVGVALEPVIIKLIEQGIQMGMLHIKAHNPANNKIVAELES